jgi:antitoxin component YwqK of YwqJK toxin-antitoxin module
MKDGLRNGISKTYDERGILVSTCEFVNDSLQGWMINYIQERESVSKSNV